MSQETLQGVSASMAQAQYEAKKPVHLGALDSFRGIAAVSVVILHLPVADSISRFEFFKHAGLFVPFFFVLSGFVIPYVYDRNTFSFKRFMIARSFRILPLYWTAFACVLALECLRYIAYHKFGILKNEPFTGHNDLSEILPHLLLLQSWLGFSDSGSFNAPAWSLSVEWYLYIAFGLLMFVPRLARYALFAALATLAYFHFLEFFNHAQSGIMYFFSGCLMYFIFDKLKNICINSIIFTVLEVCALTLGFVTIYFGLSKYAIFTFDALVLVFALSSYSRKTSTDNKTLMGGGVKTSFLETKIFAFFGVLSYAIYITHSFSLDVSGILIRHVAARLGLYVDYVKIEGAENEILAFGSSMIANIYVFATLCFVILVAYLAHKFIEKPCINYGKRILRKG